jgi:hypothetical protein
VTIIIVLILQLMVLLLLLKLQRDILKELRRLNDAHDLDSRQRLSDSTLDRLRKAT